MFMFGIFNGVKLNYEVCGEGNPFILLHGNGEDSSIFEVLISELKRDFKVYAIDSRSHGESDVAPLSYYLMAEDVRCFIEELKLENPIVYGFSDGGIVAIILASRYPELVNTIIASGANVIPKGLKWYLRLLYRVQNRIKPSPYLKLMINEPHLSADDLNKIKANALILCGSRDMIPYKHSEFIATHVPNATLKVLKGESHSSYVINSPKLYGIIKEYLS